MYLALILVAEAVVIVLLSWFFEAPGLLMLLVPVPPLTLIAAILFARYASSRRR